MCEHSQAEEFWEVWGAAVYVKHGRRRVVTKECGAAVYVSMAGKRYSRSVEAAVM
jgi:hypothetical protein